MGPFGSYISLLAFGQSCFGRCSKDRRLRRTAEGLKLHASRAAAGILELLGPWFI